MTLTFRGTCLATFKSEIEVPDDIKINTKEEALEYIMDHYGECPAHELEYIGDVDEPVTLDDIDFEEE